MGFIELFLIGVGLSMDAFAVSICKGLGMQKIRMRDVGLIALFFGGFQALMPLLGWILGSRFEQYIVQVDHWIAFALLLLIGGNMILETIRGKDEACCQTGGLKIRELLLLAIATSIDALAVGISFAFLQVKIGQAVATIGVTTFLLSGLGVFLGKTAGGKFQKHAKLAGGILLVLMGTKILLEHLGVLPF